MATLQLRLYGDLKQYGSRYKINADTAAETLNCLYCQIDGFKQKIINGWFRIRINGQDLTDKTLKFGLHTKLPDNAVIHIVPKTAGSKSSGVFSFVAGAALFAVGFFAPVAWGAWGTALMASGAGMMIGGVAQTLTRTTATSVSSNSESTRTSTSFSSLSNTAAQGSVMPLPYGRIMVGSRVMSQGVETMDVE